MRSPPDCLLSTLCSLFAVRVSCPESPLGLRLRPLVPSLHPGGSWHELALAGAGVPRLTQPQATLCMTWSMHTLGGGRQSGAQGRALGLSVQPTPEQVWDQPSGWGQLLPLPFLPPCELGPGRRPDSLHRTLSEPSGSGHSPSGRPCTPGPRGQQVALQARSGGAAGVPVGPALAGAAVRGCRPCLALRARGREAPSDGGDPCAAPPVL